MTNIEDFLKDGAVEKLNVIIEKAQKKHASLLEQKVKVDKPKAPNVTRGKKGKTKKVNVFEVQKIKDKLRAVSQKLVIDLVECIETHDLLKEGIYAENLKFDVCGSADNIVPWLHCLLCYVTLMPFAVSMLGFCVVSNALTMELLWVTALSRSKVSLKSLAEEPFVTLAAGSTCVDWLGSQS